MRWFYNLLSLSLSVTPIIILLLSLNPVLKKRYSAKLRYILWIVVSLRMLLPYSFANHIPVLFKAPVKSGILPSASVTVGQISKIAPVNLQKVNDSFGEVLFVIYVVGVILYFAYVIFSYIGFRRDILRWSKNSSNYEIQTILEDEKIKLNIKRNVLILISKKVSSPMLVGLIKPILVLPSEVYKPAELRMILDHELVHLKRNDILVKTIIMFTSAVHWFNPAVHLMAIQANKDMEQSCDDYVINGTDVDEKRLYCNIILKLAVMNKDTSGPVFSTNIISSRKNLELRIKDIFDNSKKKSGVVVLVTVILLVIISGTIFNVSGAEQSDKVFPQYDSLNEYSEVKNENKIQDENKLENNFGNNEFKNQILDENNETQNIDDESDSVKLPIIDGTQQAENGLENSLEIHEEIIIEDELTEIVIVDLNQLENQLQETKTVDISDE
jgi:beta-lactamase regulating signal transducer with metallopeptidase domain